MVRFIASRPSRIALLPRIYWLPWHSQVPSPPAPHNPAVSLMISPPCPTSVKKDVLSHLHLLRHDHINARYWCFLSTVWLQKFPSQHNNTTQHNSSAHSHLSSQSFQMENPHHNTETCLLSQSHSALPPRFFSLSSRLHVSKYHNTRFKTVSFKLGGFSTAYIGFGTCSLPVIQGLDWICQSSCWKDYPCMSEGERHSGSSSTTSSAAE